MFHRPTCQDLESLDFPGTRSRKRFGKSCRSTEASRLHRARMPVPTANPKQLTDTGESVDSSIDERSLQIGLVHLDQLLRSRAALEAEIPVPRHQLAPNLTVPTTFPIRMRSWFIFRV